MTWRRVFLAIVLVVVFVAEAPAGDFWRQLLIGKTCWPDCVGKYCCDDYRPKCPPPTHCVTCFTCDDYCQKCPPVAKPAKCFLCDDYCPKPFRLFCPAPRGLKCFPRPCAAEPCR